MTLITTAAKLGLLLLALAYLAWKAFDPTPSVDFKHIWFAGLLWSENVNAYGPDYPRRALEFFHGTNVPQWMLYPPSWYPLARLVAILPLEMADRVWRIGNAALLVIGALITWGAIGQGSGKRPTWPLVLMGVFLGLGTSTAMVLSMGQTAPLIFLGLALFLRGTLQGKRVALAFGIGLLMLKPNIGLPFAAFALVIPGGWLPVLAAAAVSGALALPALLPFGPLDVLRTYLGLLADHGMLEVNRPPSLTGVVNLAHHLSGRDIGSFTAIGLAVACALGIAARWRIEDPGPARKTAWLFLLLAMTDFFVPLHTYDLLLLAPLVLMSGTAMAPASTSGALAIIGLLAILRMNNLAGAIGLTPMGETYFQGSLLASIGLLALGIAAVLNLWRPAART